VHFAKLHQYLRLHIELSLHGIFFCIFLPAYISRFYQEVTLPDNFECDRCTLQLVRHAGEWVAPGGVYRFWSCADISIVNSSSMSYTKKNCSYPLSYHNTE